MEKAFDSVDHNFIIAALEAYGFGPNYDDFRYRHKCLVDRLLSQGYKALRLEKSFKKFYGRYQDLIEKYRRSVNAMVSDSFPGQFLLNM